MHKSFDEIEFLPDPTSDYGVICNLESEKSTSNVVAALAPSSLIRSSSFLKVISREALNEFEKQPDSIMYCGVSCLWASGKIPID